MSRSAAKHRNRSVADAQFPCRPCCIYQPGVGERRQREAGTSVGSAFGARDDDECLWAHPRRAVVPSRGTGGKSFRSTRKAPSMHCQAVGSEQKSATPSDNRELRFLKNGGGGGDRTRVREQFRRDHYVRSQPDDVSPSPTPADESQRGPVP